MLYYQTCDMVPINPDHILCQAELHSKCDNTGMAGEPVAARRGAEAEIRHVFRSPEARPARFVSDVFACACAAPLLLLLLLWARLRINFSLFPLSLSALVFHLSLGGTTHWTKSLFTEEKSCTY
jgi:hypothetical protein